MYSDICILHTYYIQYNVTQMQECACVSSGAYPQLFFYSFILILCLPVSAYGNVFCSYEYFASPFSVSPSSSSTRPCFHPFIHLNPLAKTQRPALNETAFADLNSSKSDSRRNLQEQKMFGHQERRKKKALPTLLEELLCGIPKDMQNVDILLDVALARKFAIQRF